MNACVQRLSCYSTKGTSARNEQWIQRSVSDVWMHITTAYNSEKNESSTCEQ